jgi:hypothetical protein
MVRKLSLILVLLITLPVFAADVNELIKIREKQLREHPDKIKYSKIINATYGSLGCNDYCYVNFKTEKGKHITFFKPCEAEMLYFFLEFRKSIITLKYEVFDCWIPEAGGYITEQRVLAARIGKLDYKTWWKKEVAKFDEKTLREKYEAIISKETVSN